MTERVIVFPKKPVRKKLSSTDVEKIAFVTADKRTLYIEDQEAIVAMMAFVVRNKITIFEK